MYNGLRTLFPKSVKRFIRSNVPRSVPRLVGVRAGAGAARVVLRPVDGGEDIPLGAVGGGGGCLAHLLQRVRHRGGGRGGGACARVHRTQHVVEAVHLGTGHT